MLAQKFSTVRVSKMAISSFLRQISYSFNTSLLLVNFIFVKRKNPKQGGGVGGTQGDGQDLPQPLDLPVNPQAFFSFNAKYLFSGSLIHCLTN